MLFLLMSFLLLKNEQFGAIKLHGHFPLILNGLSFLDPPIGMIYTRVKMSLFLFWKRITVTWKPL
jgi:hypothetical protein